ncbi:hypothetical protein [Aurantimonas sp. VKM B-3413]|uniref:hypothetical protein n=1 Tax=Aurantimonas sp. VKM B-3413 TaxID=2779401 RepID=UPI001E38AB23|nr:hypothetical protein [Aurantimonas sp. VKM B-3413]MCB8836888.1 hypothetical protein [Aurantimonas sp. VKM B-3413]
MSASLARRLPLLVFFLVAALSGCTGSDMTIGMGPNGPVPPAEIGATMTSGAPVTSAAALAPSPAPTYQSLPPAPASAEPQRLPPPAIAGGGPLLAPPSTASSEPVTAAGPAQVAASPAALPQRREAEAARVEAPSPQVPAQEARVAAVEPSGGPQQGGEIQFLPVVGAPERKAELLARALAEAAPAAGLEIRPANGPKSTMRLKGYFSAFSDGGKTTLIYVWDVLDREDKRVHRIQGQERVAGTADDPWSLVSAGTLKDVARRTLKEAAGLGFSAG